jgi:polyisoprenoid-binding protein YceI
VFESERKHAKTQTQKHTKFMKKVLFIAFFAAISVVSQAQNQIFLTKQGKIHFYSKTAAEAIEASNKTANAVLDATTGKMEWGVTVKGFLFKKALMQEHFNENYMESTKFPQAKFKGQIDNLSKVDFKKDGTYNVTSSGKLTMHGETKDVSIAGQIIVKGENVQLKSKFRVIYADFKIDIPSVVKDSFSDGMDVDLDATLTPKK